MLLTLSHSARACTLLRRLRRCLFAALLLPALGAPGYGAEPAPSGSGGEPTDAAAGPRFITNLAELDLLPEALRQQPQRVRLDYQVYFHDPRWKVAWGRCAGVENYLTLGEVPFPLRPGQRVQIEGRIVPVNGMVIDELRVTPLADPVPLNPLRTAGHLGETERFDKRPVLVEGLVDQQSATDTNHLRLELVSEGRAVTVRLLLDGSRMPPDFEGTMVRIQGVYSATNDPTGGPPKLELWVQGPENIEVIGSIAQDSRFALPATNVDQLSQVPPGQAVRVEGVVRMQQPGKSLTIRDQTGQTAMLTAQTQPLQVGDPVEAVGLVNAPGGEWTLREAVYRRAKAPVRPAAGLRPPVLRLAEQVRDLGPEEADRRYPVQLSGVVTWSNPAADFFFINDSTGGVSVRHHGIPPGRLLIGNRVDILGVTAPGNFTATVEATSVVSTARIDPPESRPVTLEQALTGIEDAQWVTMNGYVRDVTGDGPWGRIELTTSAGEFTAVLPWHEQALKLKGAVVRVRGVCSVQTNARRQLTGIQLWVPSLQYISIEEAEPADPFSVPSRSIASLRQYNTLPVVNRRVRMTGVVVHQVPGEVLHVQEGSEGLLVLSRDRTVVQPGDRIEVVGFPGRERSRVVLREAVFRKLSSGGEPEPQVTTAVEPVDAELDGRLVSLQASLLDTRQQGQGTRLILQTRDVIFEALLEARELQAGAEWIPGSLVAVRGVYQVEYDEYRRPHAVRLLLRSAQDVTVLRQPPWLTVQRALAAIGVLAVGLVLGTGWVLALRRRVHRQTGQIREQIESEKAARLEAALARASKLESLGVLAGGIAHDFNNLLTVVMGNLSLARMDRHITPDTVECLREGERAAQRARDLTQQLITFAKGGEPVRVVTVLPDVVREATQFALHGSKVRSEFEFAPELWPADVDRGQIGQVVHNLIINATHAMPAGGVIRISLANEAVGPGFRPTLASGRYLRLVIADCGTGIAPEFLPRIFDPYFTTKSKGSGLGLATVYSIVKKHQGLIEVDSRVGSGTTFTIWLPASAAAATAAPPTAAVEEPPACAGRARVLLMDDEPAILKLGAATIARLGMETVAVDDGAAALRAYRDARDAGRPFDLVILDLTVPGGMGGAEAMERLRELDPEVRAVVSSGYSNDKVMADYRRYGFRGVVSKPYDIAEFIRTIEMVLADRRGRVEAGVAATP